MAAASEGLPAGRYGPSADARADRRLKILGAVLGAVLLCFVGWLGWRSLAGGQVSAEVIKFQVVSDQEVQIHLEVHKPSATTAVCTLRSVDGDRNEVGRKDVAVGGPAGQVDTVVTLRTTARATSAELVRCDGRA